jgi:predicted RNA-binding Zn-ribbon protein involved in translation (DUF1610 family)
MSKQNESGKKTEIQSNKPMKFQLMKENLWYAPESNNSLARNVRINIKSGIEYRWSPILECYLLIFEEVIEEEKMKCFNCKTLQEIPKNGRFECPNCKFEMIYSNYKMIRIICRPKIPKTKNRQIKLIEML